MINEVLVVTLSMVEFRDFGGGYGIDRPLTLINLLPDNMNFLYFLSFYFCFLVKGKNVNLKHLTAKLTTLVVIFVGVFWERNKKFVGFQGIK